MEDPAAQFLEVQVRDSHLTGRSVLGRVKVPLARLPFDSTMDAWLPVEGAHGGKAGEIHLQMTYKVRETPPKTLNHRPYSLNPKRPAAGGRRPRRPRRPDPSADDLQGA